MDIVTRAPDVRAPASAVLVMMAALLALYAVAFDNGLMASHLSDAALASGGVLHEAFHDARHLLGVPCH